VDKAFSGTVWYHRLKGASECDGDGWRRSRIITRFFLIIIIITLSSLRSVEIKFQGDGSHSAEDSTLMVSFVSSLSVSATCTQAGAGRQWVQAFIML
jgi:hypothetical protein